jgi:phage baseplate assembly protein W
MSDASAPFHPHVGVGWAFPVRWQADGVERSADEPRLAEAMRLIIRCALGSRRMRPEFGADSDRYVFAERTEQTCARLAADVRRALLLGEPRVVVDDVTAVPAGEAEDRIDVVIEFRIDRHRRPSSLVLPFYTRPEP